MEASGPGARAGARISPHPNRLPSPNAGEVQAEGGPIWGNIREQRPTSLAFDDQGRLIAHDPLGLRVWSPGSITGSTPPILRHPMSAVPVGWRNPTLLARTTDGRVMALVRPSAILLWHSDAPVPVQPVTPPPRPGGEPVPSSKTDLRGNGTAGPEAVGWRCYAVQVAPAGDQLYVLAENSTRNNTLHVWALDATTGGYQAREVPVTAPLPERFASIALRPDGRILAIGDHTGTVTLYDTRRWTVMGSIKPPTEEAQGSVLALAFSPDGRDLAVGTQQGTILIWPANKPGAKEPRLSLPGQRGMISSMVFDREGRRLASTARTDPLVEVWDLDLIRNELASAGNCGLSGRSQKLCSPRRGWESAARGVSPGVGDELPCDRTFLPPAAAARRHSRTLRRRGN